MVISEQQIEAAKRGEPVHLQADDVDVVMLRADLFSQLQAGQAGGDPRAAYPAILRAWDQDDDTPEDYEEYRD